MILSWRRLAAAAVISCVAVVAGCSKAPDFTNVDITGSKSFATDFSLPDTHGKVRTLADYKGKAVVLFVGYTHCPDVCPATMADLAQALQRLGPDASRVQVLFVTLDPARDTSPVLEQYVHAFNPAFEGLRPASDADLAAFAKAFRVVYAKVPAKSGGDYTLDHTAGSYVFDPSGQLRLFARDGQGPDPWVHDLKLLLD